MKLREVALSAAAAIVVVAAAHTLSLAILAHHEPTLDRATASSQALGNLLLATLALYMRK